MSRFFGIFTIIFLLQMSAHIVFAQECPVVYGGGQLECGTPTPQPANGTTEAATPTPTKTPAPTKAPANNQSKGGLPVQAVTKGNTTPATGPEALGLIGLLPAAVAGMWLRKKA